MRGTETRQACVSLQCSAGLLSAAAPGLQVAVQQEIRLLPLPQLLALYSRAPMLQVASLEQQHEAALQRVRDGCAAELRKALQAQETSLLKMHQAQLQLGSSKQLVAAHIQAQASLKASQHACAALQTEVSVQTQLSCCRSACWMRSAFGVTQTSVAAWPAECQPEAAGGAAGVGGAQQPRLEASVGGEVSVCWAHCLACQLAAACCTHLQPSASKALVRGVHGHAHCMACRCCMHT